jgi:periplasmic protein TonB
MTEASLPDDVPITRRRRISLRATPRERRRLRMALLASGLFHALILALLIGLWRSPTQEAPATIPVKLVEGEGAAGAAGGGNSVTAGGAASATGDAAAAEATPDAARPPADQSPEQTATATPAQQAETVTVAPPNPEQATPPAEPPPVTAEAAEPIPPRKPTPPRSLDGAAQPKAQPTPPNPQPPAPSQATASDSASSAAAQAGAVASTAGAGGRGRGDEGAGRAAFGDGPLDGPGDDYLSQLQRWIGRFRKYPDEAIKQKQEGTVAIGFKLARNGTVLDAWIEKSSGYPLLDDAALNMIHAASPVPKVPDKYQGETLTLKSMPAKFSIGVFDRIFH